MASRGLPCWLNWGRRQVFWALELLDEVMVDVRVSVAARTRASGRGRLVEASGIVTDVCLLGIGCR